MQLESPQQVSAIILPTNYAHHRHGATFTRNACIQMKVISTVQIGMGAVCILFGILLIMLPSDYKMIGEIGFGFWIGISYALVGGIGLAASLFNSKRWIIAAMIFNIGSSVISFISHAIFVSEDIYLTWLSSCEPVLNCEERRRELALDSLLIIIAVAELVANIWSYVLCCRAVCQCCKPSYSQESVAYNQAPSQVSNTEPGFG